MLETGYHVSRSRRAVVCFSFTLPFNAKRGGGSNEKTHDHFGCNGAYGGLDGADRWRPNPAARELPRAGPERAPDPQGRLRRTRALLSARNDPGLRPRPMLVPPLLIADQ